MTTPSDANIDTLKLIHQGTNQNQRVLEPLKPTYVPVDERKIEHRMVFAKAYAKYLNFYGSDNKIIGDWQAFFERDVSIQLAIAAIQDIEAYKTQIKQCLNFLDNAEHDKPDKADALKQHLGYLFSYIGTLAIQLDRLKQALPEEIPLKLTLSSLIQNQLAPALAKLISYHKAFPNSDQVFALAHTDFILFGTTALSFDQIYQVNLSKDWISNNKSDWQSSHNAIAPDPSIYDTPPSSHLFTRLNYIAKNNLFTDILEQFLKVFARVINEAKQELAKTFNHWNKHEPHYALFLTFLNLFDYARAEINTLTERHLDFYYREILRFQEKPAEASHAHVLIELAKHIDTYKINQQTLFKAGKDELNKDVFFANTQSFIANQAKVSELKTLYRDDNGRFFASPIANSADGLGEKLTNTDQSWHPFANKIYQNGSLLGINMPTAEIGFAIASHYLWLAEGNRTIQIEFFSSADKTIELSDLHNQIICLVSTEKGWFEKAATKFVTENNILKLELTLTTADPAIIPYNNNIHGYNFASHLPILLVKLRHQKDQEYIYAKLQHITINTINLAVQVTGLKSLAVFNDFGAVDTSKPFQPFGALPVKNSTLIIGSKEAFQKKLTELSIHTQWQNPPSPYNNQKVFVTFDYLQENQWQALAQDGELYSWVNNEITLVNGVNITEKVFTLKYSLEHLITDAPDFLKAEPYSASAKQGFIRLKINNDFGQSLYEQALIDYIKSVTDTDSKNDKPKPIPPVSPALSELSLNYSTDKQIISLTIPTAVAQRSTQFFHLTAFGQYEQSQHDTQGIFLIPQFQQAEFYIGITGLKPPQNLALLFQVADGTAAPLLKSPTIQWSYLSHNQWLNFAQHEVQDDTDGLLNSGIITFTIPDKASSDNTVLPTGQHWLKASVSENCDAVCKLIAVLAQGLKVSFQNQHNAASFLNHTLAAETISKLKQPVAAIKKVSQPFDGFGGRATEQTSTFYTRISERLRHKDRAITLWDYEHLILEAFPQIYQVKCLNHTRYESDGIGIYNELAAGYVTVVTIPNLQTHKRRDPLRPYTSLGLLKKIESFLQNKVSYFVTLCVRNPLFEEVSVAFKVKFHLGVDETFHKQTLQQAITRFLSPWAFSDSSSPTFGGKIYQSVLVNFIEEQYYVDYVADFQLFHHVSLNGKTEKLLKTEIEGSKAVSILVSVPAIEHQITPINPKEITPSVTTCPCASS